MRIVVGTMTGTSMDGVDAAKVCIDGYGESICATFLQTESCGLGSAKKELLKLASIGGTKEEMETAAINIGEITAIAISKLHLETVDIIALHGQTVYHEPPKSVQLIDPEPISKKFPCTILTNPRQGDLLLGGQGAPITPLADWVMFRSATESTSIVNLGGFCNITVLPAHCQPNQIRGFDVCCCNLLLNAIARERLGEECDMNGETALKGCVDKTIRSALLDRLSAQASANRSLGTKDDLGEYALQIGKNTSTQDLLASAVVAIGACISSCCDTQRILLAGGGVYNRALCNAIKNNGTTEALGIPVQAREAMAMAILGALAQDGVSITLPQITGRKETSECVGWIQASP
ncbi:MAG: anhydro-N-acetylmuramic acid kinase [Planctomycetes bacterium]|nr:anhydro-N-acetylmuramic acid kinase [Planctomycetota bacterium]